MGSRGRNRRGLRIVHLFAYRRARRDRRHRLLRSGCWHWFWRRGHGRYRRRCGSQRRLLFWTTVHCPLFTAHCSRRLGHPLGSSFCRTEWRYRSFHFRVVHDARDVRLGTRDSWPLGFHHPRTAKLNFCGGGGLRNISSWSSAEHGCCASSRGGLAEDIASER